MSVVKWIHVICVVITSVDFIWRGILMMRESPLLHNRWVRTVPHVNDSILLISATVLAVQLGVSVLSSPWLLAKIIALFVYIGLGLVALRYGKTKQVRTIAWVAAVGVLFYMIAVAISKSPLPGL